MSVKILTGLSTLLIIFILACSKSGSSGGGTIPPPEGEENIAFSIDPDPGSAIAVAQSGRYTFKVNVTSKLPSTGVVINLLSTQESNGAVLENKNTNSQTASTEVFTETLNSGTVYKINVKVTSLKTSTNSQSKEFKVARK